jgi:hypothetical protein
MILFTTREEWLTAAVTELRPMFDASGNPIAQAIRVTCGYPYTASRSGTLGETHADIESADGSIETMISPELADPAEVFLELLAQLSHAADGAMGLNSTYGAVCTAMGLLPDGPASKRWARTVAGPDCGERYSAIIECLGDYPHAALARARKVQSTNMLKLICPSCGYVVRSTNKWINLGLPICGIDQTPFILESKGE